MASEEDNGIALSTSIKNSVIANFINCKLCHNLLLWYNVTNNKITVEKMSECEHYKVEVWDLTGSINKITPRENEEFTDLYYSIIKK